MPLAPPLRLDLSARAWLRGVTSLFVRDEADARRALEEEWGGPAFLSVRSGLCALLESSGFAPGSEILVSALTIADIPKIIAAHGFVPVAVDVDPDTLAPTHAELSRRASDKTRAVIVAHLFGARVDLDDTARFVAERGLLLIEDCAQAFVGPAWRGDPRSDVAMFSFGTLKTQTALGGALFTVKDDVLRARMAAVEASWPAQSTRAFAMKLAKAAAFLVAQNAVVYGLVALAVTLAGSSIGVALRKATRGFPAQNVDELLGKLRLRPCPALLGFLRERIAHFDPARLAARAAVGEALAARLARIGGGSGSGVVAGRSTRLRTHWIFGVRSTAPDALRRRLGAAGLDASGASNITAVGGARAQALVEELVFVPAYPELSERALQSLVDVIEGARGSTAHEVFAPSLAAGRSAA